MAALGRPQPYRLQTSRPQVGLGPRASSPQRWRKESRKPALYFASFFALKFWQVYPPTLSAHCFCMFFAFCFAFCRSFRLFFAFLSLFFCLSLETSSNFSFPDAAWTGSQGLPVPASRVPAPPCPQPRPRSAPTQALPHLPRPRPRSATQIKGMQTVVLSGLRIPTAVSIDLAFTNGQIEKIRKIKKERERKRARRSPRFLCCGSGSI